MQFWPCSNPLCPWRHKITTSSPICVTSFMNVPQSVVFFLINFVKMCTPVFLVVWRHLWMSPWFFCNFSNVFCYCFFQVKMLIPWSSKKWCTNWPESWVIWEKTLQTLGNFTWLKQLSNLTLQWHLQKDLTDTGQFLNCLEPSCYIALFLASGIWLYSRVDIVLRHGWKLCYYKLAPTGVMFANKKV